MLCIIVNTISLALTWPGQPKTLVKTINIINYVCTVIFAIEVLAKIASFGLRYFKDEWNVFDFIVSMGSIIGVFLNELTPLSISSSTTILRSFRILRVFKLFKKQKSLKIIYETFIVTLPALVNVGGLLMLLVFIFAVLSMTLFAEVMLNGPMS